jgi:hypothetical protein
MKRLANGILLALAVGSSCVVNARASTEPLRLDVSPDNGRRDHLTRDCENWVVAAGKPANIRLGRITLTIQPADGSASELAADWWKAGLVYDATMASDGVHVDDGGLAIKIRGLAAGKHSLVTYHNSIWDAALTPIDVRIDGKTAASQVIPSRRVTDDADVASAFVEFDVTAGSDVVVEIMPHGELSQGGRVILNGLELDTVDPAKKAIKPTPAAGDEHVAERPTLAWQAAASARAHDVYLGTDRDAVANATPSSPEYRGRRSEASFECDAADSAITYCWRVDELEPLVSAGPEVTYATTKGDVWSFRVRHLAFPGAEGFGRFARGGRGGRVIEVTNLDDRGPGSLRAAVEAEGSRTVVFNVGGLITLQSRLVIRNPYLTIAGQTAPGKGICIRKFNLGMGGTHDVIVRYVRVRPGNISGMTLDGMGMAGTDHSIIDHASISWTQDEAFSSRAAKNITLQRTLISEAMNVAGHKNYEAGKQHGFAASIGGDVGSFHHNLLAHCAGRNWSLAGGLDKGSRHTGRLDIRNNVVYNWGHRTTDGGAQQVNFVNNYYKPGPASRVFHVLMPERHLVPSFGPQVYYVEGNIMEGHYGANERYAGVRGARREPIEDFVADEPLFESHVTTQSAEAAYEDVLADVGCNVPMLDDHDRRVIEETRAGTTTYAGSVTGLAGLPDSENDVGGWEEYPEVRRPEDWDTDHDGLPNAWEAEHGTNPNSPPGEFTDANADPDGDGYTNLEDYLNSPALAARNAD